MNIKAVDYKGKGFILMDEDMIDDDDFVIEYIDVPQVIEKGLVNHVQECLYYGIPAYVGNNKELKLEILKLENKIIL